MCEVIPTDQLPDCDSCKDPTKRIAGKAIDLEGPGKTSFLYGCDNTVCRKRCWSVLGVILRQELSRDMKGGEK